MLDEANELHVLDRPDDFAPAYEPGLGEGGGSVWPTGWQYRVLPAAEADEPECDDLAVSKGIGACALMASGIWIAGWLLVRFGVMYLSQ